MAFNKQSARATARATAREEEDEETLVIAIEGNIGSGKSTFLKDLRDKYKEDDTIGFVDEPVDAWDKIKDASGKSILEKYYENQEKYAFSFQMMAYISRLSAIRNALKKKYKILIMERSVFTDSAVFAKMLHDDGKIEEVEYKIYMEWFREFTNDLPPIYFVYVRAEPEICFQRVLKRNRQGEQISLAYLQNCHKYHEEWLICEKVYIANCILTLNANADIQPTENGESYLISEWSKTIDLWFDQAEKITHAATCKDDTTQTECKSKEQFEKFCYFCGCLVTHEGSYDREYFVWRCEDCAW